METDAPSGQDLTSGNLKKQLWSLAWPIMLSIFFYTLYNIVDTIWVGRLSAEAIAAVSISQIALFVMVSLGMGITVGSGVVIAMKIGAKDQKGAEQVLGQSFVLAALFGFFFTLMSLLFVDTILNAAGAVGEVFPLAKDYFLIVSGGSVLMFLLMTIVFAFNAQGDSFTPTKLFAISTLLNVVLDPILIFGYGPIPSLGVVGAAVATLISQALFICLALRILGRETQMIPFRFRRLSMEWSSVREVFRIGLPASLSQVIQPIGLATLMYLAAQSFGEIGTVAFSIAFRVEFFAYLPAIGFGFGSMAIIAQNVGAQNIERAKDAYTLALVYGAGAACVLGLLGVIFSKYVIHIFTSDPVIVSDVQMYLVVVGLSYAFLATSLIVTTVFQAVGRSWFGFWITLFRYMVLTVPVAIVLIHVFDSMNVVWSALAIGNVLSALVGVWWVRRYFKRITSPQSV